ncbi:hypothetical protein GFL63_36580 [Rhizobium leguminosarum bv. viciae]|nr:hypothetical protein [Rhizobium leguminosarum bv. viciae]
MIAVNTLLDILGYIPKVPTN